MEQKSSSMRDKLLARLPQPENLEGYREETVALLAKHEKALFWEKVQFEDFQEAEEPSFAEEDAAAVHQAIGEIGLKHREGLVLHFLEDLSMAEIAKVVGCSEGTVKSRIHYAKRAMKEILSGRSYGTGK